MECHLLKLLQTLKNVKERKNKENYIFHFVVFFPTFSIKKSKIQLKMYVLLREKIGEKHQLIA